MVNLKKKILFLTLSLLAGKAVEVGAQESLVVYPYNTDVSLYRVGLAEISKLTLDDDKVVIHGTDGSTVGFAYADVMSMKLDGLSTGIMPLKSDSDGLSLYCRGGYVGADGWTDGIVADAVVCDAGGRMLICRKDWDGRPISVVSLAKGIYIFKVNGSTIKFIKS